MLQCQAKLFCNLPRALVGPGQFWCMSNDGAESCTAATGMSMGKAEPEAHYKQCDEYFGPRSLPRAALLCAPGCREALLGRGGVCPWREKRFVVFRHPT